MLMTFLDDTTMLFGDTQAVHNALDARDGEAPSMTSNANITNLILPSRMAPSGACWTLPEARTCFAQPWVTPPSWPTMTWLRST